MNKKRDRKEYMHQYYLMNRERILKQQKQYQQENNDTIAEYKKCWRENNSEYMKQYYQENKVTITEKKKQHYNTPIGRAAKLLTAYSREDKKNNRGECTLTAQWIIDNIFSKPCHYCGVEGWNIIGCDRINNDLPHTPDNVVPCCAECNIKRNIKPFEEFLKEMGQLSPS